MTINKTLLQNAEPKNGNVLWAKPINDSVQLNIYNKGEWHPINGSGNGGNSSSGSCNCWDVEIVVRGNSNDNMVAILKKGDFNSIIQRLLDGVPFSARVINVMADGTWTELPFMAIDQSDSTPIIQISQQQGYGVSWNPDNTLMLLNGGSSPK